MGSTVRKPGGSPPEGKSTVAELAAAEPLSAVAAPFPAVLNVARTVSAQALVSWRGNRYSVPPELAGSAVRVSVRLGAGHLDITTTSPNGLSLPVVIARHRLAPDGAGVMVRDHGHVIALDQAALAASTPAGPHRSKQRIPPGEAARAAAGLLRAAVGGEAPPAPAAPAAPAGAEVVVDLARYVAAAKDRNTLF
jgi:Mu transposase-like protein